MTRFSARLFLVQPERLTLHAATGATTNLQDWPANQAHSYTVRPLRSMWITGVTRTTNARGLPAYEMLTDFQDMSDGGGGFLRVLTFDIHLETVSVTTVSTETSRERENGAGFEHSLEILEAYKPSAYDALAGLGIDTTLYDALFEEITIPGSELREQYRASLYDAGQRDSEFVLEVPFPDDVAGSGPQ